MEKLFDLPEEKKARRTGMIGKYSEEWLNQFIQEGFSKYGHYKTTPELESQPAPYVHRIPETKGTGHYALPIDKPVQVSFSGGRRSAYMLHNILEDNNGLPEHAKVTFMNTGREHPATLDFVHECSQRWEVPIIWLEYRCPDPRGKPSFEIVDYDSASKGGEVFEMMLYKKKFLPNRVSRHCTAQMKILTAKRYLRWLGWDYWYCVVGFSSDEQGRMERAVANQHKDRWTYFAPMIDAGHSKYDSSAFWKRQPFDLKLPNVKGNCYLGNCLLCFLKSEKTRVSIMREFPEEADWWIEWERKIPSTKPGVKFNTWRDGDSLQDLKDFDDRHGRLDMLDDTSIYCAANDGECTT